MAKCFEERHTAEQHDQTCIIHYDIVDSTKRLSSPQSVGAWKTLLMAAKVRNHTAILDMASNITDDTVSSNVWFHSKCRSLFTMKRDLLKFESGKTESSAEKSASTNSQNNRTPRQKSSGERVFDDTCIFCEPKRKYTKGNNSDRLRKSCELRSEQSVRKAAEEKQIRECLLLQVVKLWQLKLIFTTAAIKFTPDRGH